MRHAPHGQSEWGPPAPSDAELTSALSEALEQQTATAEILRVISSSPNDVQPLFAAVLTSAARLCNASDATIFQVDGDELRIVAHEGPIPLTPVGAIPLIRGTATGRAVLDRRTIHVPDLQAEVDEYPESSALARSHGSRTVLNVPLLRGAEAIGVAIRRTEVRPFTDRQIELLKMFADQAMIAIENVRLFIELQEKNRALTQAHAQVTESLEQQTATAEILRVIAGSPTDLQPVFEDIAASALRPVSGGGGRRYGPGHGDQGQPEGATEGPGRGRFVPRPGKRVDGRRARPRPPMGPGAAPRPQHHGVSLLRRAVQSLGPRTLDAAALTDAVSEKLGDWAGLMGRRVARARQLLRHLVVSRIAFTPQADGTVAFVGHASIGPLVAGTVLDGLSKGGVSPTGLGRRGGQSFGASWPPALRDPPAPRGARRRARRPE